MAAQLSTTRYVPPGSYIGQLITPQPGAVADNARLPVFIGAGSRFAVGRNSGIRRSYVYAEALTFPSSSPYLADLDFPANGDQEVARLFKADGTEVRKDNWSFVSVLGAYTRVLVNPEVFDNTATYKIDYQSTSRNVQDPSPFTDLREIINMGTSPDNPEFKEYQHYYIVTSFTSPGPKTGTSVANNTATLQAPTADIANTGTGTITQATSSAYNYNYNQYFRVRCTAASGVTPNRTATFEWEATPTSGAPYSVATPPVPLNAAEAKPTFTITETPAVLTATLQQGIVLQMAFGATNFATSDIFTFNALGPAKIDVDDRHTNTNQFADQVAIVPTLQGGSTGTMAYAADSSYTGTFNNKIMLKVTAVSGVSPNRTATFVWAMYGNNLGVNGTFTINEATPTSLTQTLTSGVKVLMGFGGTHFVIGDQFVLGLLAPRIYYTAKDSRDYSITINAKTSPTAGNGHVEATFVANTPEGRFGTFSADANTLPPSNPLFETGAATLPDNVNVFMRNMVGGPVASVVTAGNRFTVNDVFSFSVIDEEKIAWDLSELASETIQLTSILTDVTGAITGTPNTKYVILQHTPSEITSVVDTTPAAVSYATIANSPYVYFVTAPTTAITISYTWRSAEPDPGQLYYMTASYLRPDSMYNSPMLVTRRQSGRDLLAPSTTTNHLYIMNEAAFDAGVPGCYFIQVKDSDGDGVYTDVDFREAILASETTSRITDVIVLGHFTSLGDAMSSVTRMNDPFARRERLLWVGCPIGTEIGSADTAGTLVYYAKRTLQVYGSSPAHGTRILVGPTEAKRMIKLEDGTTAEVTVDGSFIAGSLAALTASFTDPSATILRKQITGWSYIETFGLEDSPENLTLGGANIIPFMDLGNQVYQINESVTVDTFAPDFHDISSMTQKQYVTRYIRNETDSKLVSIVVSSAEAGIGLIKGFLISALSNLAGGVVAPYQDDNGNERPIDPDSDVVVYRDSLDPTKYHMMYAYYLKHEIKRLFGLYSVDTNDFGKLR